MFKKISGKLVVASLSVNTLILPFCGFWTSKHAKHTLLLYLSPLKASPLLFMLSLGLQRHQPELFSSFQTWKYVNQTLIQAFLPLKTRCGHGLLHLKTEKHHSYLAFNFLTTVDFIYYLFQCFSMLFIYTVPSFVYLQRPKTLLLHFWNHFSI